MQERIENTSRLFFFFLIQFVSRKLCVYSFLPVTKLWSGSSLLSSRCAGWRTNLGRKQLLKSLAHTPPGLFCFPFQQSKILGSETGETPWLCLPRLWDKSHPQRVGCSRVWTLQTLLTWRCILPLLWYLIALWNTEEVFWESGAAGCRAHSAACELPQEWALPAVPREVQPGWVRTCHVFFHSFIRLLMALVPSPPCS